MPSSRAPISAVLLILLSQIATSFSYHLLHDSAKGYTSFSYRLPADSYAIFRLGNANSNNNKGISIEEKSFVVEEIRERRNIVLNRRNPKKARLKMNNQIGKCDEEQSGRKRLQLAEAFPECRNSLKCTSNKADSMEMTSFGRCLVSHYPQTRDLTMSSVSVNDQIVDFDDDKPCTDFVKSFFENCQKLIPSCIELQASPEKAVAVLGCLFSNYPDLMLPLFHSKIRENRFKNA